MSARIFVSRAARSCGFSLTVPVFFDMFFTTMNIKLEKFLKKTLLALAATIYAAYSAFLTVVLAQRALYSVNLFYSIVFYLFMLISAIQGFLVVFGTIEYIAER